MEFAERILPFLKPDLVEIILRESSIGQFTKGTEILKEKQYVKVVPIVINGLVKVYSRFDEKELLLYYIESNQSCVMTFYAALKNTPSKVNAKTQEDSTLLLLPVRLLPTWLKEYPEFNELFYDQFNLRYSDLLDAIGSLLLNKMDKRLYDLLKKKSELNAGNTITMSHSELADELGTAREVITRAFKKLVSDGKVIQESGKIRIIDDW